MDEPPFGQASLRYLPYGRGQTKPARSLFKSTFGSRQKAASHKRSGGRFALDRHLKLGRTLAGKEQGIFFRAAARVGLESRELLISLMGGGFGGDAAKEFRKPGRLGQEIFNREALRMGSRDFHIAPVIELERYRRVRIQSMLREQSMETGREILEQSRKLFGPTR
jgi:hypothetical protein